LRPFFEEPYDDTIARVPEIMYLSLHQSVELPLNPEQSLTIKGLVLTRNGLGMGQLEVGGRGRLWKSTNAYEAGIILSSQEQIAAHFELSHPLSIQASAKLRGSLDSAGNLQVGWGCENNISSTRTVSANFNFPSGFIVGVDNTKKRSKTTLACSLSSEGATVIVGASHVLTDLSHLRGELSLGASPALSFTSGKSWNALTKGSMTLQIHPRAVTLKLRLRRGTQDYVLPLILSAGVDPWAVAAATLVPSLVAASLKLFVLAPWKLRREAALRAELRREHAATVARDRANALHNLVLLEKAARANAEHENALHGLVVEKAWYGKAYAPLSEGRSTPSPLSEGWENMNMAQDGQQSEGEGTGEALPHPGPTEEGSEEGRFNEVEVIDVTLPLQYLVDHSTLHLQAVPKSELLGFYDPLPGESKTLSVQYRFKDKAHFVVVDDADALSLPRRGHAIQ